MKRTSVFKLTNDDWYPNYPENTVELIYIGKLSDGKYRVAVWGADDCGYERDFEIESEAILMYQKFSNYPYINKDDVIKHNFVHV